MPVASQRVLQMEADNGLLLPILPYLGEGTLFHFQLNPNISILPTVAVLIFFIAGLLISCAFERVDNLGAYCIPPETSLLISSAYIIYRPRRQGESTMLRLDRWQDTSSC
jgi:hypothetical protein